MNDLSLISELISHKTTADIYTSYCFSINYYFYYYFYNIEWHYEKMLLIKEMLGLFPLQM